MGDNSGQPVKRADGSAGSIGSQMDVKGGGIKGSVSHQGFNSKQVHPVFIKVGSECVTERMAGKPAFPAEPVLMGMDMPGEEESVNRPVLPILFREEIAHWLFIGKPILSEQVKGSFGKDGITVMAVFAMGDVEAEIFTLYILIAQGADFANTQAGRIHDDSHCLLLQIRHGREEVPGLLFGRDIRQVLVEFTHGKLRIIPRLVKDIEGKKAKLGNGAVNGTVRKISGFLEPPDVAAQFIPGNIFWCFMKDKSQVIQISPDISAVIFEGMVCKAAQGDHLPESI